MILIDFQGTCCSDVCRAVALALLRLFDALTRQIGVYANIVVAQGGVVVSAVIRRERLVRSGRHGGRVAVDNTPSPDSYSRSTYPRILPVPVQAR